MHEDRLGRAEADRKPAQARHGFFAALTEAFFEHSTVYPVKHRRWMAVGKLDDQPVTAVVFTPLGSEAISVVSMRAASARERRLT